ncbi:MAG: TrkA C-terminal domain-containing protein [Pyrobaculum sp.]
MTREALILDSNDDLIHHLIKLLLENGYVLRILAPRERTKLFEKSPVYIHNFSENYERVFKEIDFSQVEIAIFPSPNDSLNMALAKVAKSNGVPMVIITVRSDSMARLAEEEGIEAVTTYHCVLSRVIRLLNLKFTKILPLKSNVALLEVLVTSDSKILGKTIGEIEEETGIKVALVRDDQYIQEREVEIQEGDYLIAIGPQEELQRLLE